jgi:autotransporter-associated beta strand protein
LDNNSSANFTMSGTVQAFVAAPASSGTSTITISGSGTTIVSGVLQNVGATGITALTKEGTGLLTLSGTNTNTGVTTLYGGCLRLDNASALSSGNLEITTQSYSSSDAVLELGTGNTAFTRAPGTGAGQVNIGGTSRSQINNAGFASVSGNATVNLGGSGAALTWGAGNFFGTANTGGNLILGSPNVAGTVDFQNPINLAGNRTITALNGTADVDGILSGVIANGSGTRNLTKDGAGTLALTAANTYNGTTTISAGTLQIGHGGTAGSLAATSMIANNGTLAFNRSDTLTQGTHFSSSAIGGTGSLVQKGSGTLILNAANTFTGTTTISAGTLQAAAASALGSTSGIMVNAGGTLLVSANGSIGTTTNITLSSTATGNGTAASLVFSSSYNGTVGTLALNANSIFDLGADPLGVQIRFSSITGLDAYTLSIYNWTGTTLWEGGTGNNLDQIYAGGPPLTTTQLEHISFYSSLDASSFRGTGYQIMSGSFATELGPVPEPSTWVAIAALAITGGAIGIRRHRRPIFQNR